MELIREIYKEIADNSKLMDNTEHAVMRQITELTSDQKAEMTLEEYERFRGVLFKVASAAQEEAFIVGVRYGITLLIQGMMPEEN